MKELLAKLADLEQKLKAHKALAEEERAEDWTASLEAMLDEGDGIKADIARARDAEAARAAALARADEFEASLNAPDTPRTVGTSNTALTTRVHERVKDDPSGGFADLGELAMLIKAAGPAAYYGADERMRILATAGDGLSQDDAMYGGYAVPPTFAKGIQDKVIGDSDSLVSRCDVYQIPVGAESVTFKRVNEESRANSSRWGGIRGYWKSELSQMKSSRPSLSELRLEPQQLSVYAFISDKLLKNGPVVGQLLSRAAADEINFKMGDAIVNGTGVGQPKGILTGAVNKPRVRIAAEAEQAAATIVSQNIIKMWARLLARSEGSAIWLYNKVIFPQLPQLKFDVGSGGQLMWMPAGGLTGAPTMTLIGKPMVPCEYAAALGTEGDLILVDFSGYAVGLRGSVETGMSIHLKFDYNQTAFRFLFEADGQPWLASSITPYKGTDTQSNIVTLIARS